MWAARLLLFCVVIASSGCYYRFGVQNVYETVFERWNDLKQRKEFRHLADLAWQDICSTSPEEFPKHYVKGFKKGFVDFLMFGGNGEPPPLPPWIYRTKHYDTPNGPNAIEDWYAGFRHGSAVAMASGIRNFIIKPIGRPPLITRSELNARPELGFDPGVAAPFSEGYPPEGFPPEDFELAPAPTPLPLPDKVDRIDGAK